MEECFVAMSEGRLEKITADEQAEFKKAQGFEKAEPAISYEKKTVR